MYPKKWAGRVLENLTKHGLTDEWVFMYKEKGEMLVSRTSTYKGIPFEKPYESW